jgi:hypothetical protein
VIDSPLITDDALTALALAADLDAEIDVDAVPWNVADTSNGPLPDWYMPAPTTVRRGWRARAVAGVIILAFLTINAFGLCITYGHLVPA